MNKKETINIYGDGAQIRDFIYVKDIAKVCVAALQKEDLFNQVINYSSNNGISVNELFNLMKDIYGYELDAVYLDERKGDIKNSILSNQKAGTLLADLNLTDLKDGIIALKNSLS